MTGSDRLRGLPCRSYVASLPLLLPPLPSWPRRRRRPDPPPPLFRPAAVLQRRRPCPPAAPLPSRRRAARLRGDGRAGGRHGRRTLLAARRPARAPWRPASARRTRHGGRLPSSLPIASLPLLHAGKLGHDGGDPGRSGGDPGRGRSERSGRGWPITVRRSGEEWHRRARSSRTRMRTAEAGRRGARTGGRPERRGRCGGDGGSPFPCSSGVDVGRAELVLTRAAAPCTRCASAAVAAAAVDADAWRQLYAGHRARARG